MVLRSIKLIVHHGSPRCRKNLYTGLCIVATVTVDSIVMPRILWYDGNNMTDMLTKLIPLLLQNDGLEGHGGEGTQATVCYCGR